MTYSEIGKRYEELADRNDAVVIAIGSAVIGSYRTEIVEDLPINGGDLVDVVTGAIREALDEQ